MKKRYEQDRTEGKKEVDWEVNIDEELPSNWLRYFLLDITIAFLVMGLVCGLMIGFWSDWSWPPNTNAVKIGLGVLIFFVVCYAIAHLDKTPLRKYNLIHKMCSRLRKFFRYDPTG
jgi:hypothetical protein